MQPEHQHCVVDAHATLRAGTRDAHHALHTLRTLDGLARGRLSPVEYTRLLRRLHAFYRVVDELVTTSCTVLLGARAAYRYHPRAPLLAADIAALADAPEATVEAQSHLTLPSLTDAAALAGVLYVVDGAMLGAATLERGARRVLAQNADAPDGADDRGLGYWTWARHEAATRWARTLALLVELLPTTVECERASASASATFAALHAWLAPLDPASC